MLEEKNLRKTFIKDRNGLVIKNLKRTNAVKEFTELDLI